MCPDQNLPEPPRTSQNQTRWLQAHGHLMTALCGSFSSRKHHRYDTAQPRALPRTPLPLHAPHQGLNPATHHNTPSRPAREVSVSPGRLCRATAARGSHQALLPVPPPGPQPRTACTSCHTGSSDATPLVRQRHTRRTPAQPAPTAHALHHPPTIGGLFRVRLSSVRGPITQVRTIKQPEFAEPYPIGVHECRQADSRSVFCCTAVNRWPAGPENRVGSLLPPWAAPCRGVVVMELWTAAGTAKECTGPILCW